MKNKDEAVSDRMTTIEDEAGLWFARMDAENAANHREGFDTWLRVSPDHQKAYDRIARTNRESLLIGGLPEYAIARHGGAGSRPSELASPGFWRSKTALAASLVLGVGLGIGLYWEQLQSKPAAPQATVELMLMTRLGEIRQFRLADGSALTLDTASRAVVSISGQGRHIHLLAGRMRLKIVQDPRPFNIDAGAGRVTMSGGLLDLALAADRQVSLRLMSGNAQLHPLADTTGWSTTAHQVIAGQSLVFSQEHVVPASAADGTPPPPAASPDWPGGWVDCRAITLRRLIELANRYSSRPIVLEAPELGQVEVSGRFKIADTGNFVRNIADQYELTVAQDDMAIHLQRK